MDAIHSIIKGLLTTLDDLHATVYGSATAALARASQDFSAAPMAIVLAFALGIVHALMLGHGKTVVFSYFLCNGARLMTGVGIACKIAALHVSTAVLLALVIGAAVVRFGRMQGTGRALEIGSYAAVTLIGAWLLYRAASRSVEGKKEGSHHHHRGGILAYAVGCCPAHSPSS